MKTAVICFEEDRKDWVGHLSRCVVGCTPGICASGARQTLEGPKHLGSTALRLRGRLYTFLWF